MKNVLFATMLSLLALNAYSQVRINQQHEELESGEIYKKIISRIQEIKLESLIDDMKHDGVSERKFGAVLGLEGSITDVEIMSDGKTTSQILPFTIKITSDNRIAVSMSGIDLGNGFESFSTNRSVLKKLKFLTFEYDDGVKFRDIRSVKVGIFDGEIAVPLYYKNSNQYFAPIIGLESGFKRESITLDNGQKIELRGRNEFLGQVEPLGKEASGMGLYYNAKAGLELKDKFKVGTLTARGIVSYEQMTGALRGTYGERKTHETAQFIPEVSLTRNIGKKTTATLGVAANIHLMNKVNNRERDLNSEKESALYTNGVTELGNRSRQPVSASLKINF